MFDASHTNRARAGRTMIEKLGQAIEQGQLHLVYQPVIDARSGETVSLEALLRWNHPVLGELQPAEFLPLIDNHPMGERLGLWVLQVVLRQTSAWCDRWPGLCTSINLSVGQLLTDRFTDDLRQRRLDATQTEYRHLAIEVAESVLVEDLKNIEQRLTACRELGMKLVVDDAGNQYASLTHLCRLKPDFIKLDRRLVQDASAGDPVAMAQILGMSAVAQSLNIHLVAKGVVQAQTLQRALGTDSILFQGYSVSHPLPPEQIPAWLEKNPPASVAALPSAPKKPDI